MSKADVLFVNMCEKILEEGFSSEGMQVRARWEDGTAAHTIKTFGVVNRYDLEEEFPALTLRPTAIKTAVDEVLWIWQKKSNNIKDLKGHIWDEWADENGSIGKAYGYQMGLKYKFAQGEMDQVDNVLWQLKNTPYSRRILTNIYKFDDLAEMNLEPCAYSMTFNVTGDRLNAVLNQRSQDIIGGQQLERGSVFCSAPYVCSGQRPESGRTGSRDRRRPYLRQAYTSHRRTDIKTSVSCP